MEVPKCLRGDQEGSRESQAYRFAEHTQLHPSEKVSEVELDNIQGKYHVFVVIFPRYLGMVRVGGK